MKLVLLFVFVVAGLALSAQKENIPATENFTIEGKVKKELTVSLADLSSYKSHSIDSIVITNHLGERRSTLKKSESCFIERYSR